VLFTNGREQLSLFLGQLSTPSAVGTRTRLQCLASAPANACSSISFAGAGDAQYCRLLEPGIALKGQPPVRVGMSASSDLLPINNSASSSSHRIQTRLPELDGFRALAVCLILNHHFGIFVRVLPWYNPIMFGGWIAVPLFFVLSSMLLTLPFLRAGLDADKCPSTRRFYERRALRIFPLFYLSMLIYMAAHAAWRSPLPNWRELVQHVFFLHNFQLGTSTINAPYWSLAVEVQFYLAMPLIGRKLYIYAQRNDFRASILFGCSLTIAPLVYRILVVCQPALLRRLGYNFLIYSSTVSNFDSFGLGILCAVLYAQAARHGRTVFSPRNAVVLLATGLMLLYVLMCFNPERQLSREASANWFTPPVYYTLINASWAACILATLSLPRSGWRRLMSSRAAVQVSAISYSLYLWQWLCIDATQRLFLHLGITSGGVHTLLRLVIQALLVITLAPLSYYGFESRFLRYSRR